MADDLNLRLPPRDDRGGDGLGNIRLLVLLIVFIALVGVIVFLFVGKRLPAVSSDLSGTKLEELALKLENEHLPGAAARTWTEYIESTRPGSDEAARIWFRVGKLYQDETEYERALEAYYRSEAIAKVDDLEPEISRRSAECLEALGKFAALNYELEKRTSIAASDSTGGSAVVAEVGTWKITRTDLDMMIEAQIDAQLSQLAASLTPEEQQKEKEKLLASVLKQGEREKWLERFIVQEMLYRRAVEDKLTEDPEFRALTRQIEREILAQKVLGREYASRISSPTPDELRAYYQGHKDEFKKDGKEQPYDDVKQDVAAAVRTQKEMDIEQQLFAELKDKYNVVIHRAALGGK
jgi:tetratricopeptide (TPR) repeat protein